MADDRRRHEQRRVVNGLVGEERLLAIAEDVGPGTLLRDRAARGEACRRGRSGADDADVDPVRAQPFGCGRETVHLVLGSRDALGSSGVPMATVREHATDGEPARFGGLRQHEHVLGSHARARATDIDLDHDHGRRRCRLPPRKGARDRLDAGHRIDANRQPAPVGQPADSFHLGPVGDDRVPDEQVFHAVIGEDLGLADRGHGQAHRACGELAAREGEALMRLRVGPQGNAALMHQLGHATDPRVDPIEIDDDGRGVERGSRLVVEESAQHRQHLGSRTGRLGGDPVRGKIPLDARLAHGTARWAAASRGPARQEGVGEP